MLRIASSRLALESSRIRVNATRNLIAFGGFLRNKEQQLQLKLGVGAFMSSVFATGVRRPMQRS